MAAAAATWCDLDPPSEHDLVFTLQHDEDQACWLTDDAGVVIAVPRWGSVAVKLLAVAPSARGSGIGAELLNAVEAWAEAEGFSRVIFGAAAPGYLWPAVELGLTSLETFLFGRGYRPAQWFVNQVVAVPADLPMGLARRATSTEQAMVGAFCRQHYPQWETEARWSFLGDEPRCAVWLEDSELLGFACWSVTREGWFGPMATRPDRRGSGRGTGTLAVALRALAAAGQQTVEISWVGPERFYAKVAGARVHRAFRVFARDLPGT